MGLKIPRNTSIEHAGRRNIFFLNSKEKKQKYFGEQTDYLLCHSSREKIRPEDMDAGWSGGFLTEDTLFAYNLIAEGAGFDYLEQCKFATVKI